MHAGGLVPKIPSVSSRALSFAESEETQAEGLASKAPSGAINLRTYRLTDSPGVRLQSSQ
jgi:hypothetical protein